MRLPWKNEDETEEQQRIRELENRIEELEDEKQRLENRFEAEKERRSKLSREKQEAEEELNRLRDKVRQEGGSEDSGESPGPISGRKEAEAEEISFQRAVKILDRLDSIESEENDLVTVYSESKIEDFPDLKDLRNSINSDQFSKLQGRESFAAFLDDELYNVILFSRPFFSPELIIDGGFSVSQLREFIQSEKYWCVVTAGETKLFREENGEYEEVERVKNRVDKKHTQGGFSQKRFERKREEQIENHLQQVEEVLEDYEDVYLLGDKRLCQELNGEYLGGFNPNRSRLGQFYDFKLLKF